MVSSIDPIILLSMILKIQQNNGNNNGNNNGGNGGTSIKEASFDDGRLIIKMKDGTSFSAPFSNMLLHQNKVILDKLSSDNGQLKYDGKLITNLQETVKNIILKEDSREIEITFADDKKVSIGLDPMLQNVVKEVLENENITGGGEIPSNMMTFFGKVDTFSDLGKINNPKEFETVIVENDDTKDYQRSLYIYKEKKWLWIGSLSKNRDFKINPINLDTEVIGSITEKIIPNTIARVSQLHNHNNKDILDRLSENSYGDILFNGKKISTLKIRDKENKVFNNISELSLSNFLGISQGDGVQLSISIDSTDLSDMPKVHYNGRVLVSNSDTQTYELKSVEDIGMYKENYSTTISTDEWGSNTALGYYEKNITHNLNSENLIIAFYDENGQSKILEYTVVDKLNIKVRSNTNEVTRVVINCSQGTTGDGSGSGGGNLDHTHPNLDILNDFSLDKYGQLRFRQHIVYPNFDPYSYNRKWENQNNATLTEIVSFRDIFNQKDMRVITGSEIIIENRNNITGNPDTDTKNEVHIKVVQGGITTLDTKIKPRDTQKYVTGINPDTTIFIKGYFSGNLVLNYFDTSATSIRQAIQAEGNNDLTDYQLKIDNSLKTNSKSVVGAINEVYHISKNNFDKGNSLDAEIKKLQKKEDSTLLTENKTIVGSINNIKEKQDINTQNIENMNSKISTNTTDIASIKTRVNDVELTNTTHSEDISNIETNVNNIRNSITVIDEKISKLQLKEDNTLTTTNKTVVGAINEINTNVSQMGSGGGTLQSTVETNKNEIQNLKSTISNHSTEIATIKDKGTETNNKLNEVENKANSNENNLTTIQSKVSTNETEITNLKKNNNQINTKISELETSVNTNKSDIGILKQKDTDLDNKVTQIQNQVPTLQTKSDNALATTSKTVTGAINELKDAISNSNDTNGINIPLNITDIDEYWKSKGVGISVHSSNNASYSRDGVRLNGSDSWLKLKLNLSDIDRNDFVFVEQSSENGSYVLNKICNFKIMRNNTLEQQEVTTELKGSKCCFGLGELDFDKNAEFILEFKSSNGNTLISLNVGIISNIGIGEVMFSPYFQKTGYFGMAENSLNIGEVYPQKDSMSSLGDNVTSINFNTFGNSIPEISDSVTILNDSFSLMDSRKKAPTIRQSTMIGAKNFRYNEINDFTNVTVYGYGNSCSNTNSMRNVIIVGNSNDLRNDSSENVEDIYIFGDSFRSFPEHSVLLGSYQTRNLYCQASNITVPSDPRLKENIKDVDKNIVTDALKQINIIHASYRNLAEFQGNRNSDLNKLMYDANNISNIPLFAKDVKEINRYVTPLKENGEPLATKKTYNENGEEKIEPIQELVENCKEFTPNQITPALVVGWQNHEERITQLEKEILELKKLLDKK